MALGAIAVTHDLKLSSSSQKLKRVGLLIEAQMLDCGLLRTELPG
jgi:hypothetical protein